MEESIDLNQITQGFWGLTKACGSYLLEGCIASLWLHKHDNHLRLELTGTSYKTFTLEYPEYIKTQQLANSWKDVTEATEHGAACIGILLAVKLTKLEVIKRAVKTTGVDYWIGKSNDGILFQKKSRLEVSGIFRGNNADIEARYRKKCEQTKQSDDSHTPVYIAITEFSKPTSKFDQR